MKRLQALKALFFLSLFPFILIAQEKGSGTPWFFIQLSDPQFGMFEKNEGFANETVLYEKAVAEINRLKPDFVVVTGDLVNLPDDPAQIAEFKRITATINPDIPVYLTPGNHDVGQAPDKESMSAYLTHYGYDRFSFKHKGSKFVGFNSSLIKADLPKLEKKQYRWLQKELRKSKNSHHLILFCHYPIFIKTLEEAENYSNFSLEKRQKYLTLFEEEDVRAVFAGHLHNNAAVSYGRTELIITSAVGMPLGDAPSGLRIVKVYPDHIEHNYYGLDEVPENIRFIDE